MAARGRKQPLREGRKEVARARTGRAVGRGRQPRAPEPSDDDLERELERVASAYGPQQQTYADWQDTLTVVERRVLEIEQLMSEGRWVPGSSARVLATPEHWNVSVNYVERLAAEASRNVRRLVRQSPEFIEECQAEVVLTFRAIRSRALTEAAKGSAAHLMVALHANRLFGFYVGIEPARKLDHTERKVGRFDGWTREQIVHFLRTGERPATLQPAPLALVASNGHAITTNGYSVSNGNGLSNGHGHDDDDGTD